MLGRLTDAPAVRLSSTVKQLSSLRDLPRRLSMLVISVLSDGPRNAAISRWGRTRRCIVIDLAVLLATSNHSAGLTHLVSSLRAFKDAT